MLTRLIAPVWTVAVVVVHGRPCYSLRSVKTFPRGVCAAVRRGVFGEDGRVDAVRPVDEGGGRDGEREEYPGDHGLRRRAHFKATWNKYDRRPARRFKGGT